MKFKVQCLHGRFGVNSSEVVADYYPLKLEEVLAMLQVAYCCDSKMSRYESTLVNDIHGRIDQGIMGMTCPVPCKGEISSRMAVVDNLFLRVIDNSSPFDFKIALLIFELMTFEKNPEDVE